MSAPIFYEKNKIDLSTPNVSITITDAIASDTGESFVDFIRNRNNFSGWMTTDSTDAANTQMDIDMTDEKSIDRIILVDHNWDSYTIQYWNGATFVDFSTAINVSGSTDSVTVHSFNSVNTSEIRIIITAAQVTDADKRLAQLIITEELGQLNQEPNIQRPQFNKRRRTNLTISGKAQVIRNQGGFSFRMRHKNQVDDADLTLIETLYDKAEGFIVWLNAGNDAQFATSREGWRAQDFFLMKIESEYEPEWAEGRYLHGIKIEADFVEII